MYRLIVSRSRDLYFGGRCSGNSGDIAGTANPYFFFAANSSREELSQAHDAVIPCSGGGTGSAWIRSCDLLGLGTGERGKTRCRRSTYLLLPFTDAISV